MNAYVNIDKDFAAGKIDDRLYGSFLEHTGRAIYTGVFEPEHENADENGFRSDVIKLVKELRVPVVRYPGGNFVSAYKWEDGVGPRENRPHRPDLAWKAIETNSFGTNEFIRWCEIAGTEPMLAVNLGTRGMADAINFLDWALEAFDECYDAVDYMSLHTYNGKRYVQRDDDTATYLGRSVDMDSFIETAIHICGMIKARKDSRKQMYLAFDEWNVINEAVVRQTDPEPWQIAPSRREGNCTLEDALVVGCMINSLIRHADYIKIGCLAMLVNVIAPIMTEPGGGTWKQTIFYPYLNASIHGRGTSLQVASKSEEYETNVLGSIPFLDVSAVHNEEYETLSLFLVNRHQNEVLHLSGTLTGFAGYEVESWIELSHDNSDAVNSEENPDNVAPKRRSDATVEKERLAARLAPLSWNMIKLSTRRAADY